MRPLFSIIKALLISAPFWGLVYAVVQFKDDIMNALGYAWYERAYNYVVGAQASQDTSYYIALVGSVVLALFVTLLSTTSIKTKSA